MSLLSKRLFVCLGLFSATLISSFGQNQATYNPSATPTIGDYSWSDYTNWTELGTTGQYVPGVSKQPTNEPPPYPSPVSTENYSVTIAGAPADHGNTIALDTDSARSLANPNGSPVLNSQSVTLGNVGTSAALDFAYTPGTINGTGVTIAVNNDEYLVINGDITNSGGAKSTIAADVQLTSPTSTLNGNSGTLVLSNTLFLQNNATTVLGAVTEVNGINNTMDTGTTPSSITIGTTAGGGVAGKLTLQANDSGSLINGTTGNFTGSITLANGSLTLLSQTPTLLAPTPPTPAVGNVTVLSGANTISGNGTVGAVTLAGGGNAITSSYSNVTPTSLTVASVAATGTGNTITGQVGGSTSTTSGPLAITGGVTVGNATTTGSLNLTGGMTISTASGTSPALVVNAGSTLTVSQMNSADTVSVAGLTLSMANLTFSVSSPSASTTTGFLLSDSHSSAASSFAGTTITIATTSAGGVAGLASGSYNLLSGDDISTLTLTNSNLGNGSKAALVTKSGNTFLDIFAAAQYTLATMGTNATATVYDGTGNATSNVQRVAVNQVTNITTTLTNTGGDPNTGAAGDTLSVSMLTATSTSGTITGGTAGPQDVPSNPVYPTNPTINPTETTNLTFTTATAGQVTITPTAMVSDSTGNTPILTKTTPLIIDAVNDRTVTAGGPINFGRVLVDPAIDTAGTFKTTNSASDTQAITLTSTGADDKFTRLLLAANPDAAAGTGAGTMGDSLTVNNNAAFEFGGASATPGTYTLNTTVTLNSVKPTAAGTVNGTANIALTLTDGDQTLPGASTNNAAQVAYKYTAVNERTVTLVGGAGSGDSMTDAVNLGTFHSGAPVNIAGASAMVTSTGANSNTANATVASAGADANGISIGTMSGATFDGATAQPINLTENFSGNFSSNAAGAITGAAQLNITDEFGNSLAPILVDYTANVYTGKGIWTNLAGGMWGPVTNNGNWDATGGVPGLDQNFKTTDSAEFGGAVGGTATVTLDGQKPSLNTITLDPTSGNYVIAQGDTTTPLGAGFLTLAAPTGNSAMINNVSGNNTISAPITLASPTVINTTAGSLDLSGPISGAESLTFNGPGATTLDAANTYTGGTTLNSGTLIIGATGTLGQNGALTVSGGMLDLGSTTQTLTKATLSGGTISDGNLSAGSYEENGSGTTTVNANLGGGALTVDGSGTLALNGMNNTYSGGTVIANGTLIVGNSTALSTGGVTLNGGVLTAAAGVSEIDVSSFAQSGGTLVLSLTDATNYQFLKSAGTVNLSGGFLRVNVGSSYVPVPGTLFSFIQAGAGDAITGDLAGVSTNLNSLSIDLQGQGFIITQLPFATLPGYNLTSNEKSIAQAVDQNFAVGGNSADLSALVGALDELTAIGVSPSALPEAIDQLSPERFYVFSNSTVFNNASFNLQSFDNYMHSQIGRDGNFISVTSPLDSSGFTSLDPAMDSTLGQVKQHLLAYSPSPQPDPGLQRDIPQNIYMTGSGGKETAQESPGRQFSAFVQGSAVLAQGLSQTEVPHSDATTAQGQIGGSFRITPKLNAGITFAYGHTEGTLDTEGTKVKLDSFAPGVFLSFASNNWYANATGDYGVDSFTQDRHIAIGSLGGIAHSDPSGEEYSGSLDGGYDFHYVGLVFGPTLGLEYTHLTVDSYDESGFGPADLSVGQANADSLRSRLGGRASVPVHVAAFTLVPNVSASWQHEFLDEAETITSQFSNVGPTPFSIKTPQASRDSALVSAGLDATINDFTTLYLNYTVQVGQDNYFGQSATGGVRMVY